MGHPNIPCPRAPSSKVTPLALATAAIAAAREHDGEIHLGVKFGRIIIIIITIMEGSYKAHNLQKNSKRTNNKDKQITSVNPEKPAEKDEF